MPRIPAVETRLNSALAAAIDAAGSTAYMDRLIDLIGTGVSHDIVTVTRYSALGRPEFVSHRHYSDAMVRRYLDTYHACDPFQAYWRSRRRPGVVALRRVATPEVRQSQYVTEFLDQSVIRDEVGVLVADGKGACLGIFLDRSAGSFTEREIGRLKASFPVFAALHALDVRSRPAGLSEEPAPAPAASQPTALPPGLWPTLTARERELVRLILDGHPSAAIARRLGIALGTVKNHRHRIYDKLDITTERELFLQYFGASPDAAASCRGGRSGA